MSSIILEAKSLTKEYKQTLALDHINLQIKKEKFMDLLVKTEQVKLLFKISHRACVSNKWYTFFMGKFWNRRIAETA